MATAIDEDYALALKLQKQFEAELSEVEVVDRSINLSSQNSSDLDADYRLALKLQENFENGNNDKDEVIFCENVKNNPQKNQKSSLSDSSWELLDPTPDARSLFVEFDKKFFWGKLASVEVSWSKRMTLCAGVCEYHGKRSGMCRIKLSEPLLKLRPRKDLLETLLHEMIHAYLFLTDNNRDRDGHGPEFLSHMNRLNKETGLKITVYHSFHDEVSLYQQHWWRCNGPCQSRNPFFGYVKRSMNRAPSSNDTWWAEHQLTCGGTFTKVKEPEEYGKKKNKEPMLKNSTSPVKDMNGLYEPLNDVTAITRNSGNIFTLNDKTKGEHSVKTEKSFVGTGHKLEQSSSSLQTSEFMSDSLKRINAERLAKLAQTKTENVFFGSVKVVPVSGNNYNAGSSVIDQSQKVIKLEKPNIKREADAVFDETDNSEAKRRKVEDDSFVGGNDSSVCFKINDLDQVEITPTRNNENNTASIASQSKVFPKSFRSPIVISKSSDVQKCLRNPNLKVGETVWLPGFISVSNARHDRFYTRLEDSPEKSPKHEKKAPRSKARSASITKPKMPQSTSTNLPEKSSQKRLYDAEDLVDDVKEFSIVYKKFKPLEDSDTSALLNSTTDPDATLNVSLHNQYAEDNRNGQSDQNSVESSVTPLRNNTQTDSTVATKVECPVCGKQVESNLINQHLDACLS